MTSGLLPLGTHSYVRPGSPALHTRMGLAPHCGEPLRRKEGDALLTVDMQNDFLPGGALGVPDGDAVIPRLNRCAAAFERDGLPIFASRDWHPPDHCSFRTQGGPWPTHCVAGTSGAEFPPTLVLPRAVAVVSKAIRRDAEAYSAFEGTDLAEQLQALKRTRVFIGGLATDYCVRATAFDARNLGLDVFVLGDAVRAVNAHAGDGERALREMASRGIRSCSAQELAT